MYIKATLLGSLFSCIVSQLIANKNYFPQLKNGVKMSAINQENLDKINALINQKIYFGSDNNSYIELVNIMPNPLTGIMPELAIVAAARTSFLGESTRIEKDQRLYNYLYKHNHSSPSEMSEILFKISNIDDLLVRELIEDQRFQVNILRGQDNSAYIKIDLNNMMTYLKLTANSRYAVNPIKDFLKNVIEIAYPWMASIINLEPKNEVNYGDNFSVERYLLDDGLGDRWIELHECNATDQSLSDMVAYFMPEVTDMTVSERIQYMFDSNDLRPLSMFSVKMAVRAPVIVLWQLVRHRTANLNLQSGRYMAFNEEDVYIPKEWRKQSLSNKQGSSDEILNSSDFSLTAKALVENPNSALRQLTENSIEVIASDENQLNEYSTLLHEYHEVGYTIYKTILDQGAAKEQARLFLPAWGSLYTAVIKFDLMYFIRFLRLRTAPDAQAEIRNYADLMHKLWSNSMPLTAIISANNKFLGS
jgi:flavin-dependent thymidylate synthase